MVPDWIGNVLALCSSGKCTDPQKAIEINYRSIEKTQDNQTKAAEILGISERIILPKIWTG